MGKNIYFYLYKSPKFKSDFKKINELIREDYHKFLDTLPKKYVEDEINTASEDFDLEFSNFWEEEDGIGVIYSAPKILMDYEEFVDYILDFWKILCKKYFFEEIVLIDFHEFKLEFNMFYVYKGEVEHLSSFNAEINNDAILVYNTTMLKGYNEPFQFKFTDVPSIMPIKSLEGHKDGVSCVSLSPDGNYIASSSYYGEIKLWELKTGKVLWALKGHDNRVYAITITSDGKYVLSGSWDKSIKIWNLKNGKLVRKIGVDSSVHALRNSPDNRYILGAMDQHTAKVWELANGKLIQTFTNHTAMVNSVSITNDLKHLISGSFDNTIRVWDFKKGNLLRIIEGHKSVQASVSPNGKFIVGGFSDGVLKMWELATGKLLHIFEGHKEYISSAEFSADSKFIISGSSDNLIKIWDVSTGRLLKILEGQNNGVTSVAISSIRGYIVGGSDKGIKVWKLEDL